MSRCQSWDSYFCLLADVAGLGRGLFSCRDAHAAIAASPVLPPHLRATSAAAALLYSGLTWAVVSPRTPTEARRRLLTGVAAVMSVATVVNGISPSLPERAIWTPTSALVALSAWRARRGE